MTLQIPHHDLSPPSLPQFMAEHTQSDIELVHSALRPLLMMLGDYRNLNPTLLQRLTHMISLFPTSFNEKMCDSLLVGDQRQPSPTLTIIPKGCSNSVLISGQLALSLYSGGVSCLAVRSTNVL